MLREPLMEISVFGSSKQVDEVRLTDGNLEVRRVGKARYVARLEEAGAQAEVEFWTTEKGRILVAPWPERPSWMQVTTSEDATLEAIDATGIDIHIEQMDRGV